MVARYVKGNIATSIQSRSPPPARRQSCMIGCIKGAGAGGSMKSILVFVATSLSLTCLAFGAEPARSQSESATRLPADRSTDLRELVSAVGKKMHKHFLVDPRAPQTIDLGGLNQEEVTYPILLSVLHLHGMVVIADNGLLQVVQDLNARQYPMPLVNPDSIRTDDDEWVTTIVPIKTLPAAQLVPVLHPLLPQNAQLSAVTARNALIIADRSANVRRLVEIVRSLDALPASKVLEPPKVSDIEPEH
jgi:type II secretory pathway component GspD/PulD (secretin)